MKKFVSTISLVIVLTFIIVVSASALTLTGDWLLTGNDTGYPYSTWTADLTIAQSDGAGDRHSLSGSFHWLGIASTGEISGWEDFADGVQGKSSYVDFSTMKFHVEGYQVRDASSTIPNHYLGPANYEADVSPDGNSLVNGVWGGVIF